MSDRTVLPRIPPIFVSVVGPELADDPVTGRELLAWSQSLPRPRAILVLSSTWSAEKSTRGSTAPRPEILGQGSYGAPGAPELAHDVASLLGVEASRRGWDHGVWAPLVHLYPAADIPVLQLSLVAGVSPKKHFALGQALAVLPSRGCLVVGTGAIIEPPPDRDLGGDSTASAEPATWAKDFDGWVANLLADAELTELFAWRKRAPDAAKAHPPNSAGVSGLAPLFVAAGAASDAEHAIGFPIRGFRHGSFSRRCVQFGRP